MDTMNQAGALASCLADLKERGLENTVERAVMGRPQSAPFVYLQKEPPHGFCRSVAVKRVRSNRVKVMGAEHYGCQLRWEVPA